MSDRPPFTAAEIDAIPALLSIKELAPYWRVGLARAYQLDKEGAFDFLLTKPAIPPRKFSGDRLRRYLLGEDTRAASRLKRASSW